jgi:hypothetical protein
MSASSATGGGAARDAVLVSGVTTCWGKIPFVRRPPREHVSGRQHPARRHSQEY